MPQSSVPFVDLVTPHKQLEERLVQAFRDAIQTASFVGGTQLEAFEREFADYCGTRYCVGVASGTDAVRLALMGSGIGAGHAVITVAHTFIATVEAISQSGAAVEFVDISDSSYCLSPDALEAYLASCRVDDSTGWPIGKRSGLPIRAIVPVHLYGQVASMARIQDIAGRFKLLVLEDACQAHGAAQCLEGDRWRRAGSLGHAAAFSFYPGKNLGACGEAGAVTTDDEGLARVVRMLRDHGQATKYHHDLEGYNGRLDAIQAAFLRIKLQYLEEWNEMRRSHAARYDALLSGDDLLTLPAVSPGNKHVYHLYVIRTANRDRVRAHLDSAGIGTGLHYPVPLHLQTCYRYLGYAAGALPVTERVAKEILSLPMFPGLAVEQIEQTSGEVLKSVVRQTNGNGSHQARARVCSGVQ